MNQASKFMETHKEIHTPITQEGKPFLEVTCQKCEWKHTMRLNSGINIGMRLALAKHMEFWESTRKKQV
jgi:predicted aldo/keto reductase-like oxidoreductase